MTYSTRIILLTVLLFGVTRAEAEIDEHGHEIGSEILGAGERVGAYLYDQSAFLYDFKGTGVDVNFAPVGGERALCRVMSWDTECGRYCQCADEGKCDECGPNGDDHIHPEHLDFGTTAVTPSKEQYAKYPDLHLYPLFAYGVVPIYSFPSGIHPVLSLEVLAGIYLFEITQWDDPAIAALNPTLSLPSATIVPIADSEHEGATEMFTEALSAVSPTFAAQVGVTHRPQWNVTTNCPFDEGVISCVLHTNYSIGFVSDADELLEGIEIAPMWHNSVEVVHTHTTVELAADELGASFGNHKNYSADTLTASLVNAKTPGAWPIVGYEYVALRTNSTAHGRTCEKKREALQFLNFIYTDPTVHVLMQDHALVTLSHDVQVTVLQRLEEVHCPEDDAELFHPPLEGRAGLSELFTESLDLLAHGFHEGFRRTSGFTVEVTDMTSEEAIALQAADTHDSGFAVVRSDFYTPGAEPSSNINAVALPYAAFAWTVHVNFCDLSHEELRDCDLSPETVDEVVLSLPTITKMFNGAITHWNDPEIVADNPFLSNFTLPIRILSTDPSLEVNQLLARVMEDHAPGFSFAALLPEDTLPSDDVVRSGIYTIPGSIAIQVFHDYHRISHSVVLTHGGERHLLTPETVLACVTDTYDPVTEQVVMMHLSQNPDCYPLSASTVLLSGSHHIAEQPIECTEDGHFIEIAHLVRSLVAVIDGASTFSQPLTTLGYVPLFDLPTIREGVRHKLTLMTCNGQVVFDLEENKNLVPTGFSRFIVGLACFFALMCLVMFVWIEVNHYSSVVRAAQPVFLNLITFGCLLTTLTLIPMSFDDSRFSQSSLDMACQVQPFLYFIGTWLVFSGLVVKEYRIRKLFVNKNLRRVAVKTQHVMPVVVIGLAVNLAVLVAWQVRDPLRWRRKVTDEDVFHFPLESHAVCESDYTWLVPLIILQVCAFLAGVVIAYQVRSLDTRFSEGKYMTMALINQLEVVVLAVPLLVIVHNTSVQLYAVKAVVILMQGVGVFCMVVLTKVYVAYKGQPLKFVLSDLSTTDTSSQKRTDGDHERGSFFGRFSGHSAAGRAAGQTSKAVPMTYLAVSGTTGKAAGRRGSGEHVRQRELTSEDLANVQGFVVSPLSSEPAWQEAHSAQLSADAALMGGKEQPEKMMGFAAGVACTEGEGSVSPSSDCTDVRHVAV